MLRTCSPCLRGRNRTGRTGIASPSCYASARSVGQVGRSLDRSVDMTGASHQDLGGGINNHRRLSRFVFGHSRSTRAFVGGCIREGTRMFRLSYRDRAANVCIRD